MTHALRRTGSVTLVLLAVGCAAAPAPTSQAPASADAPALAQPTSSAGAAPPAIAAAPDTRLDDAERELANAERELASLAGLQKSPKEPRESEAGPKGDAPTGGRRTAPPAKAPPAGGARKPTGDAGPSGAEQRNAQTPAPCETACRALASMARSADTICRIAGDGDARCISARRRVQDSASQAAACKCAP